MADDDNVVRYNFRELVDEKPPPPPRPTFKPATNGEAKGYAQAALRDECAKVASTPEGERNPNLNIAAFNLGQLVGGGSLTEDEVVEQLTMAAQAAGLPTGEAIKTLFSGLDAGKRVPREVPAPPVADLYSLAGLVTPTEPPVSAETAPPAAEMVADDALVSSWDPRPVDTVAEEDAAAPAPTHLFREDGEALFYSGKVNGLIGESESGKTWVALHTIAQALLAGERVLMLDFEDTGRGIRDRVRSMGVGDDAMQRLDYASPHEPLTAPHAVVLATRLRERAYRLVVVDGVNAAMTLLGYDLNSNTDATMFAAKLLRPLTRTGACVVTVDHVPKNADARGKGGIGAQAKRAMMDGCALAVEVVEPFGRGHNGTLKLRVDKDRPGYVRGVSTATSAGRALLVSGAGGEVAISIVPPDLRDTGERPFRPTGLMEKVSHCLENLSETVTGNTVVEVVQSKKANVLTALKVLTDEGYLAFTSGPRGSHEYRSLRPYRQSDDPLSDEFRSPVPTVPTGSHRFPGTSGLTGSPVPPAYKGEPVPVTTDPEPDDGPVPEGYENCNRCGRLIPSWLSNEGRGYCPDCAKAY